MKTTRWIKLVLVLILFTTILQIAGVVTPLWIYLETSSVNIGVGLYYRIGCEATSGHNCTDNAFSNLPFLYNTASTYDKDSWRAVVAMETISACFGVILCIEIMVYLVGFGVWKAMSNLNVAMVVTAVFAWIPNLVGLIVYIIFYGLVITRSPDVSSRSFPWSALMCLFAAILFIIITFLIHYRCRNRNYLKNAIPTSTDSKIALNPSTKNQLMKRYFTPSPYREDRRQALYSNVYGDQTHLLGNGFENSFTENRGIENRVSRAIEYQPQVTRTIETKNMSAGTFAGNEVTTGVINDDFRGTIYEKDLGSYVQNKTGNYGTEVIKTTYVTKTTDDVVNSRPEVRDVKRENYRQQQWGESRAGQEVLGVTAGQEERVIGNETTLDQGREYDVFSELDAETVYYTGKEGFEPIGLSRRSTRNTQDVRSYTNGAVNDGYVVTQEIRQSSRPIQEEKIIEEVTVTKRDIGKTAQQNRVFRFPADHHVTSGQQKSTDYTVHTRTFTEKQNGEQLVLAPGHLSGNKVQYNQTYIYRPYSETSY